MGIGTAEEEIIVHASPAVVTEQVQAAFDRIGKVVESDVANFFVRGTVRYGLQKVRIKCQVLQSGQSSRVVVKAFADDVWGKGAREGIRKLKNALVEA